MLDDWFKSHIDKEFPEFKSGELFIAISGGVDSVVLAELMWRLKYRFTLLHCNFKLREQASDEDEAFVKSWALERNLAFKSSSFNTRDYSEENKISIQMGARDLRYHWFEKVTSQSKKPLVLFAHHRDDLVETFFINLSRSAGINGLRSIQKKREIYRRPLLPFSKDDILKYARLHGISWREDQSNQKNDYLRNHIRNKVIPTLQEKVPNIDSHITSSIEHLKNIADYINIETSKFMEECASIENDRTIIQFDSITAQNTILLQHALLDYGFKNQQSNQILSTLNAVGKQFKSDTHTCLVDRKKLIIEKIGIQELKTQNGQILLQDGTYQFNRHQIQLKSIGPPNWALIKQAPSNRAYFDLKALHSKLSLRYWKRGDSMTVLGMTGRKKISDIFIDQKIPNSLKADILLISSGEEIIWCYGLKQSAFAAVTESTDEVLEIKIID